MVRYMAYIHVLGCNRERERRRNKTLAITFKNKQELACIELKKKERIEQKMWSACRH